MKLNELRSTVRYYLGDISATDYSDANIDLALNRAYRRAITLILRASAQWEINGDVATTDIVAGQQEYTLTTPVPLLSLKRVELNLTGAVDDWTTPELVDMRQINTALSNTTLRNGLHTSSVRIFDNSLFLIDIPSVDVSGGLKIYYSSDAIKLQERFTGTVQEAAGKYLTIGNIGTATELIITLSQNTSDVLSVTNPSSTSLLVKLANTTAAKNTVDLIEAAIQALGISDNIDFREVVVSGVNWTSITGGTITTETNTVALEGYDSPNMVEDCQTYLINSACYDYAKSFGLATKKADFYKDMSTDADNIQKVYSNRLPIARPQITVKKETYI